jgi:hypothetical protein
MATPTRRTLNATARRLGAVLDYRHDREGLEHEVVADAPAGSVWRDSGVHQLVCAGADGTPWAALHADLAERMAFGVEPCDDPTCDVCHPDD